VCVCVCVCVCLGVKKAIIIVIDSLPMNRCEN